MPAPKPGEDLQWASGPSTPSPVITDPPLSKKEQGWVDSEFPPAEYFNWFMNLAYEWQEYLRDFEIQVHTWTAAQTFSAFVLAEAGISATNPTGPSVQLFTSSYANALIDVPAAAAFGSTGTYQLLQRFGKTSASAAVRLYTPLAAPDGSLVITQNASWTDNPTNKWAQDDGSKASTKIVIGPDPNVVGMSSVQIFTQEPGSGAWADNNWQLGDARMYANAMNLLAAGLTSTTINGDLWLAGNVLTCKTAGGNIALSPSVAPQNLAYLGTWGTATTAQVWKDAQGVVYLQGQIGPGGSPQANAFTLPVGFRPANNIGNTPPGLAAMRNHSSTFDMLSLAINAGTGVATFTVTNGGTAITAGDLVTLDGLSFSTLM